MLYRALHSSGTQSFEYVVQDLSLPYPTAAKFIEYTASELDVWPLWLCPLRQIQRPTFHPSTVTGEEPGAEVKAQPMLNIGLWGTGSKDPGEILRLNRQLENKLAELGGMKVLYSHTIPRRSSGRSTIGSGMRTSGGGMGLHRSQMCMTS